MWNPASAGPAAPPPGFSHPVNQAQRTFRAALQAMAHPGRVHTIGADCGVPAGLSPALTALLLTLADGDTPVWLPAGAEETVRRYLRFHCGCPLVDTPALARFAVVPAGVAAPSLAQCHPGDPAYPDQSTTLLIEVAALSAGPVVTLSGPGIAKRCVLRAAGLPEGFWRQWRLNQQGFPLGVDVFLTQGSQLCGLPRTTRVED